MLQFMLKTFKLFLALILIVGNLSAQTCERDSIVLDSMWLVAPKYWTPTDPTIYTKPACINEPYSQSVTFNVPPQITLSGFTLPLTKITVAATGAVTGLPVGLNYSCDPPNCEFLANTLGCMLISGTPTNANTPGDKELTIKVTAYSLITQEIEFPGTIAPSSKYYITVKNTGECASGTSDLSGQIAGVKNAPNPFSQFTEVMVDALVAGEYSFEVFNLLGKKVNEQQIELVQGRNQFTFDAGELPNGTYFYALGNRTGRVTNTFVIHR
jgi:Secretion system C-terminal sorting domain